MVDGGTHGGAGRNVHRVGDLLEIGIDGCREIEKDVELKYL